MGTMWDFPEEVQVGEDRLRKVIETLATATDTKGRYSPTHVGMVAHLSVEVARTVGLPPARVGHLHRAALLHDVGKLLIPDSILLKPGKLTAREWEVMQTHSALGAQMVQNLDMTDEAHWVLHHHERWDGRGYPDRIGGDTIPIQSRIIFVCDAWVAMREVRVYKLGLALEAALVELNCCTGRQFDPELVLALIEVLKVDDKALVA